MIYNYLSLYFGAFSRAKLQKNICRGKKEKEVVFLSYTETAELWELLPLRANTLRVIARRNDEAIQAVSFLSGLLRSSQ